MKRNIRNILSLAMIALPLGCVGTGLLSSCSDDYMEDLNTDETKVSDIDPNSQLTTALLQTYGDFGLMDAYRCYVTGFTQHFMGGWNVCNYAGSVHADNDMMRPIWDEYYNVAIKNLVDAISRTGDKPNLNAVLRIHRVYLMSVITDTYGDVPCSEAGMGYIDGIATPKYDTQEEIYNWFFDELGKCIEQLGTGDDAVRGDVTAYNGDVAMWKKYANSLRLRFAMRISDVSPAKAKTEFEQALAAPCGYISEPAFNAYIKYTDSPFTLYDGAGELDFRVNALGEMLYGQDSDSPTFVCATFFNKMNDTNDPRLYRICRHYLNPKRSSVAADDEWNVDVTDEVVAFEYSSEGQGPQPCVLGAPWWDNWVNAPANDKIPTLQRLVEQYPEVGFDQSNYNARMMRPFLSIKFEKADCPGVLMTSAEVEFLMAEAKLLNWNVNGEIKDHYEAGIRAAMKMINEYYAVDPIKDEEINDYIAANPMSSNPKEDINTQAWILHMMNPAEGWANLRRSDYPVLEHRNNYPQWPNDFTYDDGNMNTPERLKYPNLEAKYNSANYKEALDRMGGKDDWHSRVWWDKYEINYHIAAEQ